MPAGGDQRAVGRHGDGVEPTFVATARRHPQHPERPAAGQRPQAHRLVVRRRSQQPPRRIHADALENRRVHAGFQAQDGVGWRLAARELSCGASGQCKRRHNHQDRQEMPHRPLPMASAPLYTTAPERQDSGAALVTG